MDRKDLKAEKVKKVKEIPSIAAMVEKTFGRAMEKLQNASTQEDREQVLEDIKKSILEKQKRLRLEAQL